MCKEKTFEEKVMERVVRTEKECSIEYSYDSNNNCIHCKGINGYEYWREYDCNNNEIHYKDNKGYELWKEYDENNYLIHYKDSNYIECFYNSNGDEITKEEYDTLYNKGENNMSEINHDNKIECYNSCIAFLKDNGYSFISLGFDKASKRYSILVQTSESNKTLKIDFNEYGDEFKSLYVVCSPFNPNAEIASAIVTGQFDNINYNKGTRVVPIRRG